MYLYLNMYKYKGGIRESKWTKVCHGDKTGKYQRKNK